MHPAPSETIAQQVRKRRQLLGWTRDQLAEQCAKAGVPELTTAALTNIETGRPDREGKRRRQVTAEELFVLAYVLRFNPVDLLVKGDAGDEPYPVAPEVSAPAATVREWISGTAFLPEPGSAQDLMTALHGMPKGRAQSMSVKWFTPA